MKSKSTELPIPGSKWRGLTLQLFIWVIVPIILMLFIATFGSFTLHQREMKEMVGVLDERTVQTAASSIDKQIEYRISALKGLSQLIVDANMDENKIESILSLIQFFESGIAVYSREGNLLFAHQWLLTEIPENLEILIAETKTEASFSSVYFHPESGIESILIVVSEDIVSPIIIGAFSLSPVVENAIIGDLALNEQASVTLITGEGQVLYTTGEANDDDFNDFLERKSDNVSGFEFDQNGGQQVLAYSIVSTLEGTLILEELWADVATPTLTTTLITPLALTPVLLLALIALWYGAKKIVQPLQNLENLASELAWGDYETIQKSVGGIEEIVLLQNTLIYLAKKIQTSNEGLHNYIGAITIGQEDERRRLARELHDETIQTLIALNQRVQLANLNNNDEKMTTRLIEIENMTQEIIRDLRLLTHALRPLFLDDLGLVTAINMLVSETNKTTKTTISFQLLGIERRLQPETELALYRITQEGLSNIVRHAKAGQASVKISFTSKTISIIITDEGIGFAVPDNPAGFALGGHFGILGLFERAELISAKVDIKSVLGEGTELVVLVSNE